MYNYYDAIRSDVQRYIRENLDDNDIREGFRDKGLDDFTSYLEEQMWDKDDVTGNGTGSYVSSPEEAALNLCGNLDLALEILHEYGVEGDAALQKGFEYIDCTIRCGLLYQTIYSVLRDIEDDYSYDDEEDSEEVTDDTLPSFNELFEGVQSEAQ